ncbi:MAG: hypothetical protein CMG35_09240 [Candidatus Marinimicrobia bacterium]|nr:hypothetical protein [Candidatus Neomarinimicrobiota bacterium]|tara:strand:+ start:166 stop:390 length:225 start_codon:yes stop_codon:yes gene_type:complete
MPLPDAATREARVYALLKGQTLEQLTGQLAAGEFLPEVGNPISVEELNEDELRRLVLVKLAVESVRADWTGLLT